MGKQQRMAQVVFRNSLLFWMDEIFSVFLCDTLIYGRCNGENNK